jgi:RNA polymerase sigma-70 factor (ECF subfamily)
VKWNVKMYFMAVKEVKRPVLASFLVMGFNNSTNSANSPQILPFSPEKQPSKLPIYIGDENARQFYLKYYSMVESVCMRTLHNKEDAEDLAHDVFAYVLGKCKENDRFNIPYPTTYLSKTAANMGINKKKRTKRENEQARRELIEVYNIATNGSLDWFIEKGGGEGKEKWEAGIVDKGYEQTEAQIIVKAILEEQDETTRSIYFYKYHEDMTLEQIGEAVGLKKSAVHERLNRLEEQVKVKMGQRR